MKHTPTQLIALHEEGLTPHQIAKLCGKTTNGVRALLLRNRAYKPRPTGQNSNAVGWHIDGHGYVIATSGLESFPYKGMCRRQTGKPRAWLVPLHRKIMAEHLGRELLPTETVHHMDGDKQNNSIDNLQLRQGKHGKGIAMRCKCCGSTDLEPTAI